jgi:single-stranded-DNA-specific exonuclease
MMLVCYLLGICFKNLNKILDIVAVATIADVVPLRGDNRVYAKYGLSLMSQESRPQWAAFKHFGSTFEPMTSFSAKDVGFFVGPCINACSRMSGDISEPLNAFVGVPEGEVHENIQKLVKVNEVRKTIQKGRTTEAMTYVSGCNDRFIVVDMETCEEGIVGLVAGNICNTTYRPTIVLSKDEHGNWKGSGRSIPGIHIKEILDVVNKTNPDILVAYGGHSQACGLTVYDGKVDELRKLLNDYCNKTFHENLFVQNIVVDYVLKDPSELPLLYSQKNALEPFGCDFPEPIVMVKFKPEETRVVKEGKHLIFRYKGIEIISWNSGYHIEGHKPEDIDEVIAVGNIEKAATLNVQPELLQIKFK